LIKKPRRAHGVGADCLDPIPKPPVRSHYRNATSVTECGLRSHGIDDRIIARPQSVEGTQTPAHSGRIAPPRIALQNQDNLVIRQHSGR
jgi:hypothetical protein